jgi:3-phosphoshikimate 1-carboxyvinyltransferase
LGARQLAFASLDCRESASALRFLLPVAAAICDEFTVTGRGSLPGRPVDTAIDILRAHSCIVEGKRLPLRVKGRLSGGSFTLPGDVSSQYLSGLLFALPLIPGGGEIYLSTPLHSSAYADMTLQALSDFGINYTQKNGTFKLNDCRFRTPCPSLLTPENDWSAAAFWLCAGARDGAEVTVKGLAPSSLQGDRKIINILRRMGANVTVKGEAVTVSGGKLRAITLDAGEIPDLVPPLAMLMSAAQGQSVIENAARLRFKESDRLYAVSQAVNSIGGNARETQNGLIIHGVPYLRGGTADSFNDHRIAMLLAIASAWCKEPVTITGFEAVKKSYPLFYNELFTLIP